MEAQNGSPEAGALKEMNTKTTPAEPIETWETTINKWGDIHFKKIHRASVAKFCNMGPEDKLKVNLRKGKIVITKVVETVEEPKANPEEEAKVEQPAEETAA